MSDKHMARELTPQARIRKAMDLIEQYGCIDGAHYKQWVLDQIARYLVADYEKWAAAMRAGGDGPDTYEWDEGIAP